MPSVSAALADHACPAHSRLTHMAHVSMLRFSATVWRFSSSAQRRLWLRGCHERACACPRVDPCLADTNFVLGSYKTEQCPKPPRLCRQGYACPHFHNSRDRRRDPRRFQYR